MSNRIEDDVFIDFVENYKKKLITVIFHFVRDWETAEDILQETFLKGYEHSNRFKGNSSWYTYFYRIAINTSISYLRKQKFKKFLPSEWFDQIAETKSSSVVQKMIEKENYERIVKASEKLPKKQKKVFILKNFEEMGYTEISEILEISEGAVRSHYFQALKKIRIILKGKEK